MSEYPGDGNQMRVTSPVSLRNARATTRVSFVRPSNACMASPASSRRGISSLYTRSSSRMLLVAKPSIGRRKPIGSPGTSAATTSTKPSADDASFGISDGLRRTTSDSPSCACVAKARRRNPKRSLFIEMPTLFLPTKSTKSLCPLCSLWLKQFNAPSAGSGSSCRYAKRPRGHQRNPPPRTHGSRRSSHR